MTEDEKKSDDVLDGELHISFDYAQNMLIPNNPQQVGPIYFKTPRKCHLFGICSESLPKQVNYLTDEAELTGKGANETVSSSSLFQFWQLLNAMIWISMW